MKSGRHGLVTHLLYVIIFCVFLLPEPVWSQVGAGPSKNVNESVPGEILIKFRSGKDLNERQQIRAFRDQLIRARGVRQKTKWKNGTEHWQVNSPYIHSLIDSLKTNPHIEFAEPNYILYGDLHPNDPLFDQQWALNNVSNPSADIDATAAWDISTGNSGILVGIVDSGMDYTHPDLQANVWRNPGEIPDNGIDDDGNGYTDDYYGYDFMNNLPDPVDEHGHGTHVAGIIGAVGNNSAGVSGVAWQVRMMPLKFLGADNSGPTSAAITAIEYAIDMGVDLINASWGSSSYSQALADMVQAAGEAGILICASAGNSAVDNEIYAHYPSNLESDNIISVASSDQNDDLSYFSNWGITSVDLAAPGSAILSTLPDGTYGLMNGTSMATPMVTGSLVLLKSVFPEMPADDIKKQLLATVDIRPDLIGRMVSAGRLNVASAIQSEQLPEMSITPAVCDFGITHTGDFSVPVSVSLKNLTGSNLSVDAVAADEGFQVARGGSFGQSLTPFTILPSDSISIQVRFAPQVAQDYQQTVQISYHTTGGSAKSLIVQALGRGVSGLIITGGAVSGTWQSNDAPVYILGDIFIEAGQNLNIGPGVTVQFEGHYSLTVGASASLVAVGSQAEPVRFVAYDTRTGWNGLRITDSGNDDVLDFCYFEHGHKNGTSDPEQLGGAVYILNSDPQISNSTFYHNSATGGGALALSTSNATIRNCKISSNFAGSDGGGGISLYDSDPIIQNTQIYGNRSYHWYLSSDMGGGIYCRQSSPQLINVTIVSNSAEKGGAIYIAQSGAHPTMVNSICWSNLPHEICFSTEPKTKSIAIAYSNIEHGEAGIITGVTGEVFWLAGNMTADPYFLDAEAGDFRLDLLSPCIDQGIQNVEIEFDDSRVLIVPAMPYLGQNPDMGALESDGIPRRSIRLNSGWNLVSWNIQNNPSATRQVLDEIIPNLDVALGFEQSGLTFDPLIDDSFNNLVQMDGDHGYWLRMTAADRLVVAGSLIDLPHTIQLEEGWNLVSYPPSGSDSVSHVLDEIIDKVIMVTAFDGAALSYAPGLPAAINTLKLMLPGYGYWIKCSDQAALSYLDNAAQGDESMTLAGINELYLPTQNIHPNSGWISLYSSDLVINGQPVQEGTMIYARDPQGNLCGEMRVSQAGFFELMPVYMDDPRTADIDEGLIVGDSLSIYVNNYLLPVKIPVTVCGQMEDLKHYITGIDTAVSLNLPQKYDLGQNYPNPFNNTTFIPYQLPLGGKVEISIYNVLGQKVCDLVHGFRPPGNYREIWNGRNMSGHNVASGIYFCRMKSGVFEKMRKIILIK